MFVMNGHKRTFLKNLVKDYCNAKEKNNIHNKTNSNKILWLPNTGGKISKEFKKVNDGITFTSSKNLKSILCQNKLKLLPNSHPGVYQLDCSSSGRYIGESKKSINILLRTSARQHKRLLGIIQCLSLNTSKSVMDN